MPSRTPTANPNPEPRTIDHFDVASGHRIELDRVGVNVVMRTSDGNEDAEMLLDVDDARRLARSLDSATVDRISPRQWSPSESATMFARYLLTRPGYEALGMTVAMHLRQFISDHELHEVRADFETYRVRR
jgi:hypothetical protein